MTLRGRWRREGAGMVGGVFSRGRRRPGISCGQDGAEKSRRQAWAHRTCRCAWRKRLRQRPVCASDGGGEERSDVDLMGGV